MPWYTTKIIKTCENIEEKNLRAVDIIMLTSNESAQHACMEAMHGDIIIVKYKTGMELCLGNFATLPCALIVTQGKQKQCNIDVIKNILTTCAKAIILVVDIVHAVADLGKAKLGGVLFYTMIDHCAEDSKQDDIAQSRGERSTCEEVFALTDFPPVQWEFQGSKAGWKSKPLIADVVNSNIHVFGKTAEVKGAPKIAEKIYFIIGVCNHDSATGAKSEESCYTAAKAATNFAMLRINYSFQSKCRIIIILDILQEEGGPRL